MDYKEMASGGENGDLLRSRAFSRREPLLSSPSEAIWIRERKREG